MAGKGDKQRPRQVPKEQFDDNWDRIFGKDKPTKPIEPKKE